VKKHHLINNSVDKDDASSSEGFGGGTRLQRLVQALETADGRYLWAQNPSTVGYATDRLRQAVDRVPSPRMQAAGEDAQ
jgi:hypothetical protein